MKSSRKNSLLNPSAFFRRIKDKGLIRTMRIGISVVIDTLYDRTSGVSTAELVTRSEVPTNSENKKHGACYQPTRARPFRKLLHLISLPRDRTFVDVGCGKGRVLLLAAESGFQKVLGVEYSKPFCEIAKTNAQIFLKRKNLPISTIEVMEADATQFPIQPEQSIFFMYNPFNEVIMEKVIQNIRQSFELHPREAWLIYSCPMQRKVIEKSNAFAHQREYDLWGNEYVVYHNPKPAIP